MMESGDMNLFDIAQLRKQRARCAKHLSQNDFLLEAASERLASRFDDILREFAYVVDYGCHHGILTRMLAAHPRIGSVIACDSVPQMLSQAPYPRVLCDEGAMPFADNSVNAICSVMSWQWVNDLPGLLVQARRALKPDGLLMVMLPAIGTLQELRGSFAEAESVITGGLSPRVAPLLDIRDGGALLQRAGLVMPVVDSEMITVTYPDMMTLLRDLKQMGAVSALNARARAPLRRDVLALAEACYARDFSDVEGRCVASVEFLTLTAWKPA
jgi:NADH dehydrogenase [ubiquinone] 1 alpha subcomplex assembly factor 5